MKPEVTEIDSVSRCPLLFLFGSGILWLLVSGVLALIASAQLHSPLFFSDCPLLTHGRASALAETSFIYGWMANAAIALALWILVRLGGEPLRAQNWTVAGAAGWNIGITLALIGIATGSRTGFSFLELPRSVQPLLFLSYGAMSVPGILAWANRSRETAYASQWYAVAALFLFPWFFSIAQVMLFWAPVRGVVQAVVASWYAQAAWSLWLAPMALAVAYYVVPKVSGRVLKGYEFALLGFWILIFIGPWTAGRHLIGGPVPTWVSALAIVSSALLLFHYLLVVLNLQAAFSAPGVAVKFIAYALGAYFATGLADVLMAFHGLAMLTHFTYVETALRELALYGAASMAFFGGLYYALPRLTNRPWAFAPLVRAHLGFSILGISGLVLSLTVAGFIEGGGLLDDKLSFGEIAALTEPWLLAASAAHLLLLAGNVLLAVNFFRSACECRRQPSEAAFFRPPSPMEASAP